MREFTRPLRGFGAARGKPGAEHNEFFEPLMAARRGAESQETAAARLAQFDAAVIQSGIERALHGFATRRYTEDAPRRRALYETLREFAEPLFQRLDGLARAAAAVRDAPADKRLLRWREWQESLDAAFAAADNSWLAAIPHLTTVEKSTPSGWRRLFYRRSV
jgi:hypothetical protein